MFDGKLILFFGAHCSPKTESSLRNVGIIPLGPVETIEEALRTVESVTIDAVILDIALDATLIFP
ncbi:hypothetical protein HGG75_27195 [Ochrobactrum pseudogrignonense]|nr:hypothetical protein [Brucella pseudogrignonensis]